jgi:ADP-ribose pyrophosphatase YjhB (NUDIX family)
MFALLSSASSATGVHPGDRHSRSHHGGATVRLAGIEFGEPSETALRREMREELGVEIESPVPLGVLENIFYYNGLPGHEIVFVYDAQFVDKDLYQKDRFTLTEDNGDTFDAVWVVLSASGLQTPPVYPDGLAELLQVRS